MARFTREQRQQAYEQWGGTEHDKTTIRALLLRLRIEELVDGLPTTVIAAAPGHGSAARRLRLTVGEPGLTGPARARRLALVHAVVVAYEEICDVLHGRTPESRPPLHAVRVWEDAVVRAEAELAPATPSPTASAMTGGGVV